MLQAQVVSGVTDLSASAAMAMAAQVGPHPALAMVEDSPGTR